MSFQNHAPTLCVLRVVQVRVIGYFWAPEDVKLAALSCVLGTINFDSPNGKLLLEGDNFSIQLLSPSDFYEEHYKFALTARALLQTSRSVEAKLREKDSDKFDIADLFYSAGAGAYSISEKEAILHRPFLLRHLEAPTFVGLKRPTPSSMIQFLTALGAPPAISQAATTSAPLNDSSFRTTVAIRNAFARVFDTDDNNNDSSDDEFGSDIDLNDDVAESELEKTAFDLKMVELHRTEYRRRVLAASLYQPSALEWTEVPSPIYKTTSAIALSELGTKLFGPFASLPTVSPRVLEPFVSGLGIPLVDDLTQRHYRDSITLTDKKHVEYTVFVGGYVRVSHTAIAVACATDIDTAASCPRVRHLNAYHGRVGASIGCQTYAVTSGKGRGVAIPFISLPLPNESFSHNSDNRNRPHLEQLLFLGGNGAVNVEKTYKAVRAIVPAFDSSSLGTNDCVILRVEAIFYCPILGRHFFHGIRMISESYTILGDSARERALCVTNECATFSMTQILGTENVYDTDPLSNYYVQTALPSLRAAALRLGTLYGLEPQIVPGGQEEFESRIRECMAFLPSLSYATPRAVDAVTLYADAVVAADAAGLQKPLWETFDPSKTDPDYFTQYTYSHHNLKSPSRTRTPAFLERVFVPTTDTATGEFLSVDQEWANLCCAEICTPPGYSVASIVNISCAACDTKRLQAVRSTPRPFGVATSLLDGSLEFTAVHFCGKIITPRKGVQINPIINTGVPAVDLDYHYFNDRGKSAIETQARDLQKRRSTQLKTGNYPMLIRAGSTSRPNNDPGFVSPLSIMFVTGIFMPPLVGDGSVQRVMLRGAPLYTPGGAPMTEEDALNSHLQEVLLSSLVEKDEVSVDDIIHVVAIFRADLPALANSVPDASLAEVIASRDSVLAALESNEYNGVFFINSAVNHRAVKQEHTACAEASDTYRCVPDPSLHNACTCTYIPGEESIVSLSSAYANPAIFCRNTISLIPLLPLHAATAVAAGSESHACAPGLCPRNVDHYARARTDPLEQPLPPLPHASFFSGGGFMEQEAVSDGTINCNVSYEYDPQIAALLSKNVTEDHSVVCANLGEVVTNSLTSSTNVPRLVHRGSVLSVTGGPPCQGFASINRHLKSRGAHNNRLALLYYLTSINILAPRFLVLELVPEFLTAAAVEPADIFRATLRCLVDMQYQVSVGLLNSSSFMTCTDRQRLFIKATMSGYTLTPFPENVTSNGLGRQTLLYPLLGQLPRDADGNDVHSAITRTTTISAHSLYTPSAPLRAILVRDAITTDLPSKISTPTSLESTSTPYTRPPIGPFERQERLHNHTTVTGHAIDKLGDMAQQRINHLPKNSWGNWMDLPNVSAKPTTPLVFIGGDHSLASLLDVEINHHSVRLAVCPHQCGGLCGSTAAAITRPQTMIPYWCAHTASTLNSQRATVYSRYNLYGYAPTVLTCMRFDSTSGVCIHPFEPRAVSPREVARIQGVRDHYIIWGAFKVIYRALGNMVTPKLARAIIGGMIGVRRME